MIKMSKELMKQRIQEAIASGDAAVAQQRIEVCLWGMDKSKDGLALSNELIAELGLEKFGQKKRVVA